MPEKQATSPIDDPGRGFWLLLWAMVLLLTGVAVRLVSFKLKTQPLFVDFLAMWTGGRMANIEPARLYNSWAVSQAQAWLLGPAAAHDRPFPYPPSALVVFGPLARLPFWTASAVWMTLIVGAFGWVALRPLPRWRLSGAALVVLAPGVVWAAVSAQCAFLIGALAIGGVALLTRRPLLAGVLLGLAAVFKPTVLLMAPIALAAGGHWRALIGAGVGALALIVLSVVGYGVSPWMAWLNSASGYLARITSDAHYYTSIVAPSGLAAQLGLTGWASILWRSAFAAVGVAITVLVFHRTQQLAPRLTALFGGSILASPYAMNYETVLLVPGAVLALTTARGGRARVLTLAAYIALAVAGFPVVSAAALMIFLVLALGCVAIESRRSERLYVANAPQ